MKKIVYLLGCLLNLIACTQTNHLDLSGTWTVRLDSADVGVQEMWHGQLYDTSITLPGTTDLAGLGAACSLQPALEKPQLLHLTRAHSYIGPVWYSREIEVPADWKNKQLILHLERVLWDSQVWVDGQQVQGHEESLVTPHRYNLTPYLSESGKHFLTIRVDNRKRYDISVKELAHAYTEDTQVKWNGILGDIYLEAHDPVYIEDVQLYPDVDAHELKAVASVYNASAASSNAVFDLCVTGQSDSKSWGKISTEVLVKEGRSKVMLTCRLDEDMPLWSEFNPYLCQVDVRMNIAHKSTSHVSTSFGLRQLDRKGNRLLLNGSPLFLRGTLECCIFPLTGTPPTDKDSWKKVFNSAREYGLNHLRFHSWCPPEAAFDVADELGFYLQVELPLWSVTLGKKDTATIDFLRNEALRISREYGNHPSFCLWSLGNELQYDFEVLESLLTELKATDDRHLYTTTSFTFEKGHGTWPEPQDDFFVTQWTDRGWMRGQGVFNTKSPSFDQDFSQAVAGMEVPAITHEVGQYAVYPDLSEISRYTGTLIPLNFMAVRNDLEAKGRLDKAPQYLQASGQLAAILYKEEIERALKTAGISGFQLLDLHDFPGQGTALVGLLNAFWESKGIISGSAFREFCAPVVPLLRFPKAVYTNQESFVATLDISNYGQTPFHHQKLMWSIKNGETEIAGGHLQAEQLVVGHNGNVGTIQCPLKDIKEATQLEVCVALEGTEYRNRWRIWVYPEEVTMHWGDVKYTRHYEEALDLLAQGKKVLFNPDWRTTQGIEGKFVPVFWSPVHFPNQAGSMGVLCDPTHPALKNFPTGMHTDWQWWDLNIHSTTLDVDSLQGGNAIVEMVDNFVNNRRLASLYEGSVGSGKLMIATFDLETSLQKRPVARQMLWSILNYMNGSDFTPLPLSGFEKMRDVFGTAHNVKQSAEGIY